MTTKISQEERLARLAKKSRDYYHTHKEYREKKLRGSREYQKKYLKVNGHYKYPYKKPSEKRLRQKAAAQQRYRDKLKSLGIFKKYYKNKLEHTKRWLSKPGNMEKYRAHQIVNRAVAAGLLKRMPCEKCSSEPAHGHHDDYSKPLSVRWLCPNHHSEHHRSLRKQSVAVVV